MSRSIHGMFSAMTVSLLLATPARGEEITVAKIADTATPVPGGAGVFASFGSFPATDGGNVAFVAYDANSLPAIYTNVAGLHALATTNTTIPGGTGTFAGFSELVSFSAGKVAFLGFDDSNLPGIYTNVSGLQVVVNTNTSVPSGSGKFISLGEPSLSVGKIAFLGLGTGGQQGVYTNVNGSLQRIASTSTSIPGGTGRFTTFGNPSMAAGKIAFAATGASSAGIYSTIGTLHAVADSSTRVPGGTENFADFGNPSLNADKVAFFGGGAISAAGIYTDLAGLHVVADKSALVPGGNGTFEDVSQPSLGGGNVAFLGTFLAPDETFHQGLYTDLGGSLVKIVAQDDRLDGKAVVAVSMGREGMDVSQLAFVAYFDDGSSGVFLATIPGDLDGDGVPNSLDNCPDTIPGMVVDSHGCPPVIPGDLDRDGDVDQNDFGLFQACLTGPTILIPPELVASCSASDFDLDNDVDQEDFAIFQGCISGVNIPGNPACAN